MNKKFENFFNQYNLTINGNDAYGLMEGYEVSGHIEMLNNNAPFQLFISFYGTNEQKEAINQKLANLKLKFFVYELNAFGLLIGLNAFTANKLIEKLPEILSKIFNILNEENVLGTGYCPLCGNQVYNNVKRYQIDSFYIPLDDSCLAQLNQEIAQENQAIDYTPNNYLRGTIGAILGSLVGAVAFFVVFLLGYISAITSVIAIFLGTLLYKKFRGKPNKMMIVIVSLTAIITMCLTLFGVYVLSAQMLAIEAQLEITGLSAFNALMQVPEFKKEFTTNLIMTVIFSLVGALIQFKPLLNSVKRRKQIK